MKFLCRGSLHKGLVATSLLLSVGLADLARGDIVIDDFSSIDAPNPWPAIQTTMGNVLITEISLGNVLGDVRQTVLFGDAFNTGGDAVSAHVDTGTGLFNYGSTSGADGAATLIYSGFPAGLNVDFTNETGILIDFSDVGFLGRGDVGEFDIPVTVDIFNGTNGATLTQSLMFSGAQSMFFDFNFFSGIGTLDMSDINRITVNVDPGFDLDFSISLISTVTIPAPGAGALAVLALTGLGGRRRRRRG